MTKEDLKTAILDTEDEWIGEALPKTCGKRKQAHRGWRKPVLIMAACAVVTFAAMVFWPKNEDSTVHAYALAEAEYPRMENGEAFYMKNQDDYRKMSNEEIRAMEERFAEARKADRIAFEKVHGSGNVLKPFLQKLMKESLQGDGKDNMLSAPLNLYLALAMLSEAAAGESRQEILDLIGAESQEALREQVKKVWQANYYDNGYVKCILGDSLWLSDQLAYKEKCVETISDSCYASVFRGEMGSDEYDQALRNWINEQTGDLLKESTSQLKMDKETVLNLVSTLFFQDRWQLKFNPSENESAVFHAPSGDKKTEFMRTTDDYGKYYYADGFAAFPKELYDSDAVMYFILPDEGVSINELLQSEQLQAFLTDETAAPYVTLKVNFAMPKFDIAQEREMKEVLNVLGVSRVFDVKQADLGSLLDGTGLPFAYVSSVQQNARIMVDEEGVRAAAYAMMPVPGAPKPPAEEIDFVLDRPFLFVLRSRDGLPLLAGVVNEP